MQALEPVFGPQNPCKVGKERKDFIKLFSEFCTHGLNMSLNVIHAHTQIIIMFKYYFSWRELSELSLASK